MGQDIDNDLAQTQQSPNVRDMLMVSTNSRRRASASQMEYVDPEELRASASMKILQYTNAQKENEEASEEEKPFKVNDEGTATAYGL